MHFNSVGAIYSWIEMCIVVHLMLVLAEVTYVALEYETLTRHRARCVALHRFLLRTIPLNQRPAAVTLFNTSFVCILNEFANHAPPPPD